MSAFSDLTIPAVRLFLNLILFGSPIVIGISVAFRLTRVASPRVRYLIAVACFFAIALLPVVRTSQKTRDSYANPEAGSGALLSQADQTDLPRAITKSNAPAPDVTIELLSAKTTLYDQVDIFVERLGESPLGFWLLTLWILIAALLVGREIIGHILLRKIRREWEPASSDLRNELGWPQGISLVTHSYECPCTIGFIRPVVVLPAELPFALPMEDIKCIARHELSHARWRDPLVNDVVRIVRAVLWPSLPLWFLERILSTEREVSADRAAIESKASSGEVMRIIEGYSTALVSVAQGCANRKVHNLYNSGATHISTVRLEARIQRLFSFSQPLTHARLMLASLFLLSSTIAVVFLPITSMGLDAKTLANQRRLKVARHMAAAFINSPSAQQSTSAMNALIVALKKRDWQVDGEVKSALAEIKTSSVLEPLVITLLEDRDWRVREKMAWALGQMNDQRAVAPLIVALGDGTGEVRQTAAWALGMIGDDRATDALLINLNNDNFDTRHGAAWALGKIKNRRAVEPLITLLGDRFADVRHGAAWALGEIGDKRAVDPLTIALKDSDPDVHAQVESALKKLLNH